MQPLFVCSVKTAQFNKNVIYTQRDGNNQIQKNNSGAKELILSIELNHVAHSARTPYASGVPWNFVRWGGSTNSVEDRGQRERGSGGGSPLVIGSGGSCNLVQEISFHIVKFS